MRGGGPQEQRAMSAAGAWCCSSSRSTIIIATLLLVLLPITFANDNGISNNRGPLSSTAYVTVHYEGTSRDAEYVLGIQVLMQSLAITSPNIDRVILASESVSLETRLLFQSMGCRVISVNNIENPFVSSTLLNPNFQFTLNKLHVWNLVEYERVVYLDADNIVIRNSDDLFMCGDFCAVYMNPCHFHTGLLAITPSRTEYKRLLNELQRVGSFDGADQGFLSSVYGESLKSSPLFLTAKSVGPLTSGYRLPIGYNMNHKYYYEQYHWNLFELRQFREMVQLRSKVPVIVNSARGIPATTVGFPMAPVLKPWYYWSVLVMDLNWVWQDVRLTLPNDLKRRYGSDSVWDSIRTAVLIVGSVIFALVYGIQRMTSSDTLRSLALEVGRNTLVGGATRLAILCATWALVASKVVINPLMIASYALLLLVVLQHVFLVGICMALSSYVTTGYLVPKPFVTSTVRFWLQVLASFSASLATLYSTYGLNYPNILWKMFWTVMFVAAVFHFQAYIIANSAREHRLLTKRHRNDSHLA